MDFPYAQRISRGFDWKSLNAVEILISVFDSSSKHTWRTPRGQTEIIFMYGLSKGWRFMFSPLLVNKKWFSLLTYKGERWWVSPVLLVRIFLMMFVQYIVFWDTWPLSHQTEGFVPYLVCPDRGGGKKGISHPYQEVQKKQSSLHSHGWCRRAPSFLMYC